MASRIKTNAAKHIVCPFCSLHCDDILSKSDGKKYSISPEVSEASEAKNPKTRDLVEFFQEIKDLKDKFSVSVTIMF